jgi:hypothetical protein
VSADEGFLFEKAALGKDKEARSVLLSSNFCSGLQF